MRQDQAEARRLQTESEHETENKEAFAEFSKQSHGDVQRLEDDIRAMHAELKALRRLLESFPTK